MIDTMSERLSPIEAIMWRAGRDPALRMTVGAVVLLDHSPGADALEKHVAAAAARTPRLRRRPDTPSAPRARPLWLEDDELDVHHHVRSVAIALGGTRQLLDLASMFDAMAFDPDHPPWDLTLIEGLENGRAALYLRAHHVLTDGIGGLRLLGALLDEQEWPGTLRAERKLRVRREAPDEERRPRRTGTVTIDLTKATRPLRRGVDAARDVSVLDTAVRGVQHALDLANSVSRQVMVTGGPLSPLFEEQSSTSRFELFSIPDARRVAHALGGSRNDLLVAVAASALGLYHERMGKPADELRLATPAVHGRTAEVGGNWFVPARVEVPVDSAHPGPLFGMVAERLAQARQEPALRVSRTLAWAISMMPPRAVTSALHTQADAVDFAATAMPGLRRPRHIAGATVEGLHPFGPRLGCPCNVSAFGNDGRLDLGIALDAAAITEPDVFVESLRQATERFSGDRVGDGHRVSL
jgi:diacylglycerol O-acyltransferase